MIGAPKGGAGGSVLLDQGIHMADLMRLFASEFTEVQSFISNSWGYEVEDDAYALMSTADRIDSTDIQANSLSV